MKRSQFIKTLAATMAVAAVGLPSVSSAPASAATLAQQPTLTLYNAQHVPLAEAWVKGFSDESGIKVQIRSGRDLELANLLKEEGEATPADVFITENSPAMSVVGAAGLFAPVALDTLATVPPERSSPLGDWVGIAARTTVFVYNPSLLPVASVPQSMLDLANPEWSDRFGIAPTGADFQAIVSAVLELKGPEATEAWLRGLKANARVYTGNGAIMAAANSGDIQGGIIYHYYWYGDRAESGARSKNVELYHWMGKDPGGFVSVSGGGVLKASKYPEEAQKFLGYMTSKAGQQILADSNAMEYAIASGVQSHPSLKPLSELDPPVVDLAKLNAPMVIELMQKAGLL
jgi:iron(III) transport system substrate-binding protein